MKAQYDNLAFSSFVLWLDHELLTKGQAFYTTSSNFYSIKSPIQGYYTYSTPYGHFVYDSSVVGATVMTGVYVGNSFLTTGQSGFVGVNYNNGQIYFSTNPNTTVSGTYSFKEMSLVSLSDPDMTLLIEGKKSLRPKIGQSLTGLAEGEIQFPAIYMASMGGVNQPLAFGGEDLTNFGIGLTVVAESQYQLDATLSLLRDSQYKQVPLLSLSEMPFNIFGHLKTGSFDYDNVYYQKANNGSIMCIEQVEITRFSNNKNIPINNINPKCYVGVVDIRLTKPRFPRL